MDVVGLVGVARIAWKRRAVFIPEPCDAAWAARHLQIELGLGSSSAGFRPSQADPQGTFTIDIHAEREAVVPGLAREHDRGRLAPVIAKLHAHQGIVIARQGGQQGETAESLVLVRRKVPVLYRVVALKPLCAINQHGLEQRGAGLLDKIPADDRRTAGRDRGSHASAAVEGVLRI
jgi:hypothetical protein